MYCWPTKPGSQEKLKVDPDFFAKQVETQAPTFLWLRADSYASQARIHHWHRSPESYLYTAVIENMVVHTDLTCSSVLQFGIEGPQSRAH